MMDRALCPNVRHAKGGQQTIEYKVNSVSSGDLQKLARQISESADYSDEGSGCEKLSHW
jgi:hypothetical protein